jgi:uncharacterized protein DUF5615
MALAFLLDENVRGRLQQAIERYNASADLPLDVIQVGAADDLPLGMSDPDVLQWIEHEDRLLVSLDKNTLPGHLERHLAAGRHVPGILLIRRGTRIAPLIEYLVAVAYASEVTEWQDRIEYVG